MNMQKIISDSPVVISVITEPVAVAAEVAVASEVFTKVSRWGPVLKIENQPESHNYPSLNNPFKELDDSLAHDKLTGVVSKIKVPRKTNTNTFIAEGTSRISELQTYREDDRKRQKDQAFLAMDNNHEFSRTRDYTMGCYAVVKKDGQYGVCRRQGCTFAHSLEEIKDPLCSFGDKCHHINGKQAYDGTVDVNTKCRFRHPQESREKYYNRTAKVPQDLPKTYTPPPPREYAHTVRYPTPQNTPGEYAHTVRYPTPQNTPREYAHTVRYPTPPPQQQYIPSPVTPPIVTQVPIPEAPVKVRQPREFTNSPPPTEISRQLFPKIETVIITIPKSMAELTMKMLLEKGVTDFEIKFSD
jgi:hypothetical protein